MGKILIKYKSKKKRIKESKGKMKTREKGLPPILHCHHFLFS